MKPITYPMRPVNRGVWSTGSPMPGWVYEPKYNGYRALVHVPTRTVFNRHGEPLGIAEQFTQALDQLCLVLDAGAFKWVDCEALERRHGIGRGSLVVFDVVPEPEYSNAAYSERRRWIEIASLPELSIWKAPEENQIYRSSHEGKTSPNGLWANLQQRNKDMKCEFFEGIVGKRESSRYNVQLQSPDQTTCNWTKWRWSW